MSVIPSRAIHRSAALSGVSISRGPSASLLPALEAHRRVTQVAPGPQETNPYRLLSVSSVAT